MKRLFLLALTFATTASAKDCPVKFGDEMFLDKVATAIRATKSCDDAATMANDCSLGGTGDTSTAVIAERKCGLDFWTRLKPDDKRIYNGLQAKCDAKYAGHDGTMFISLNAFCRLNVAKLYSELYSEAEQ